MAAELLCIGTELLLGNITNGNARWLAEQLAALGIAHHRQAVVGDNRERLMAAVREASGRCRVLITTGGLGPTPDDLTTEAIAAAFDTPLVEHPEIWRDIQARLGARRRVCSPSNRKQSFLPQGAQVLPNPTGTGIGRHGGVLQGQQIGHLLSQGRFRHAPEAQHAAGEYPLSHTGLA